MSRKGDDDDMYYACWKKDGVVRCSTSCLRFAEAERFLTEMRIHNGAKTRLEDCSSIPKLVYGQAAAAIRASEKLFNLKE